MCPYGLEREKTESKTERELPPLPRETLSQRELLHAPLSANNTSLMNHACFFTRLEIDLSLIFLLYNFVAMWFDLNRLKIILYYDGFNMR